MDYKDIINLCSGLLIDKGFECYAFQVGWYNSSIGADRYKLKYNDDTLAITVISIPRMFETTFLPWLRTRKDNLCDVLDPIDECMREIFTSLRRELPATLNVDVIHDFDMNQGRYARVLMNTAGHVSGAAYYYQKSDLGSDYLDKKLYSVSVHPKYGGWFAFRAVLIFPQVKATTLERPVFKIRDYKNDDIYNLLNSFTCDWRTNEWRDAFVPAQEKYSEMQTQYFSSLPDKRKEVLENWVKEGKL